MDSGEASIFQKHEEVRCSPAPLVFRNAGVATVNLKLSHHSGLT